jgi:hypothetical protein
LRREKLFPFSSRKFKKLVAIEREVPSTDFCDLSQEKPTICLSQSEE